MQYTRVREYPGGIREWKERLGPLLSAPAAAPARPSGATCSPDERLRSLPAALICRLSDLTFEALLGAWLGVVLGSALLYFALDLAGAAGLREANLPVAADLAGFGTAIYFSFMTATSVGFGEVTPVGLARVIAIAESVAALLLFGCLVSKLVSRRQESLTEEIHRIAFENRLGRVLMNLNLVRSELETISAAAAADATDGEQRLSRLESAATILMTELRAIHDLLYRPQKLPEETILESILSSVAVSLRQLGSVVESQPAVRTRSAAFEVTLGAIGRVASEICGECVPREYAPHLKAQMDRVQGLARGLTAAA
ncbi:MAG: two pore domain potassium channel family protein [Candidatus Wallbacteria bacterium]|nr:two pore domain potassium channel family protein [Candidatus Wallbacteria bacterium]